MTIHTLVEALIREGVEFAASLPDSWLSPLLEAIDAADAIRHIPVTREGRGCSPCGRNDVGRQKGRAHLPERRAAGGGERTGGLRLPTWSQACARGWPPSTPTSISSHRCRWSSSTDARPC